MPQITFLVLLFVSSIIFCTRKNYVSDKCHQHFLPKTLLKFKNILSFIFTVMPLKEAKLQKKNKNFVVQQVENIYFYLQHEI